MRTKMFFFLMGSMAQHIYQHHGSYNNGNNSLAFWGGLNWFPVVRKFMASLRSGGSPCFPQLVLPFLSPMELPQPDGFHGKSIYFMDDDHMGMDQYLLIPFLGGWTSINPSYILWVHQGYKVLTHCHMIKFPVSLFHGKSIYGWWPYDNIW